MGGRVGNHTSHTLHAVHSLTYLLPHSHLREEVELERVARAAEGHAADVLRAQPRLQLVRHHLGGGVGVGVRARVGVRVRVGVRG